MPPSSSSDPGSRRPGLGVRPPAADLAGKPFPAAAGTVPLPYERVEFAHNSERQLGKLLDFYEIEWEYEPRTFVLATGPDALPTLAFTPDFYLPGSDLFIEVTTLNQKLVTKKNRKVRLLRESHPQIQIRLLYQRDYLELLVKYGLESPDQLSELAGDVTETATEGLGLLGLGSLAAPQGRQRQLGGQNTPRHHPAA